MNEVVTVLHSVASSPLFQGVVGLGIFDLVLHQIPSQKPIGILQTVSAFLKQLADGATTLAGIVDKVLGQNIKS